MARTKEGSIPKYIWPWMRMACRSDSLTCALIEEIPAEYLLADRGYDCIEIIEKALAAGMQVAIPPRKSRKEPRDYDRYLYKLRRLVENVLLQLKRWRGITMRYVNITSSFAAALQIHCITLWATLHI